MAEQLTPIADAPALPLYVVRVERDVSSVASHLLHLSWFASYAFTDEQLTDMLDRITADPMITQYDVHKIVYRLDATYAAGARQAPEALIASEG